MGGVADCQKLAVCGICEETYGIKGEHKYSSTVVAPTCTDKGYTKFTCAVCEESYVAEEKAASGHSYVTVVTPPTATEQGYTTFTCTVCADKKTDNYVEPLGETADKNVANGGNTVGGNGEVHTAHDYRVTDEVIAPTCTESGYTVYKCTGCEMTTFGDMVSCVGHSGGNKPTCKERSICDKCQEAYGEHAEHVWGEGCNTDCTVCGAAKPKDSAKSVPEFLTIVINALIVPLGFIFKKRFF